MLTPEEKAKKLFAVVHNMSDGFCPQCMIVPQGNIIKTGKAWTCTNCNFVLTVGQIANILELYKPIADSAMETFNEWLGETFTALSSLEDGFDTALNAE